MQRSTISSTCMNTSARTCGGERDCSRLKYAARRAQVLRYLLSFFSVFQRMMHPIQLQTRVKYTNSHTRTYVEFTSSIYTDADINYEAKCKNFRLPSFLHTLTCVRVYELSSPAALFYTPYTNTMKTSLSMGIQYSYVIRIQLLTLPRSITCSIEILHVGYFLNSVYT